MSFHKDKAESEYLGTRATHYDGERLGIGISCSRVLNKKTKKNRKNDGELNGIAKALEGAREVNMLAILTDSKPAISAIEKLDKGSPGHVPGLRHGTLQERIKTPAWLG